jgi:hypothetical protein
VKLTVLGASKLTLHPILTIAILTLPIPASSSFLPPTIDISSVAVTAVVSSELGSGRLLSQCLNAITSGSFRVVMDHIACDLLKTLLGWIERTSSGSCPLSSPSHQLHDHVRSVKLTPSGHFIDKWFGGFTTHNDHIRLDLLQYYLFSLFPLQAYLSLQRVARSQPQVSLVSSKTCIFLSSGS